MTETLAASMPDDVEMLTRNLLRMAAAGEIGLVTAQSCTGGLLASLLTDVEGASHVFERGFVTYSAGAKCELLGLNRTMVDDCDAVSEPVARAMATGALAQSHGEIAIAITGFAGAAGPDDEPGLVHFACARRDGPIEHRVVHLGLVSRGTARIACVRIALGMLREAVAATLSPDQPSA